MREDELRGLLTDAADRAPDDDLTTASWREGRRRSRRQSWGVALAGTAAAALAGAIVWTAVDGGTTPPSPAPAPRTDEVGATSGAEPDADAPSTPVPDPETVLADWEVVYAVQRGSAQPDGPVTSQLELEGLLLAPQSFTVTGDGVALQPWELSPGGDLEFIGPGADGPYLFWVGDGCGGTYHVPSASVVDGTLEVSTEGEGVALTVTEPPADAPEHCPGGTRLVPTPGDVITGYTVGDLEATAPELRWSDGALVVTGSADLQVFRGPDESTDAVEGRKVLDLLAVPGGDPGQTEWTPSPTPVVIDPLAPGTAEAARGTWRLVPAIDNPRHTPVWLSFEGDRWQVASCGSTSSAPGTVSNGRVVITGAWEVAPGPEVQGDCYPRPWADQESWEAFLAAGPRVQTDPEMPVAQSRVPTDERLPTMPFLRLTGVLDLP